MKCSSHFPSGSPKQTRDRQRRTRLLSIVMVIALGGLLSFAQERTALRLYGGGNISPDEAIELEFYIGNRNHAVLSIYQLLQPRELLEYGGPRDFRDSDKLTTRLHSRIKVTDSPKRWWRRLRYGYSYGENRISIGSLPRGVYLAQLGYGAEARAVLLNVSDLGMVIKSDNQRMLSYTASLTDGTPRASTLHQLQGDTIREQRSNAQGVAWLETNANDSQTDNNLLVVAEAEESWSFSDAYWRRWAADEHKIYVQTDRSTYRPEHQVFIKAIARASGSLRPLADTALQLRVQDSEGNTILEETLTSDAYGSVATTLPLSAGAPLGRYSIRVGVAGESSEADYGEFFVEEYQTPEYRVLVSSQDAQQVQGEQATFVVESSYLFGGPVAGAKVQWVLFKQPYYHYRYRSSYGFYEDSSYSSYYGGEIVAQGNDRLDAEGRLELEHLLATDPENDYRLTLQVNVTDEARRYIQASGSVIAYQSGVVLRVNPGRYVYQAGDEVVLRIHAEDIEGNPVAQDVVLEVQRSYWQRGEGAQQETLDTLRTRTDDDGNAELRISLEMQGSYHFVARADDAQGRPSQAESSAWVSGSDRWYWNYDSLTIEPDKPEYRVGEVARFVIRSPIEDGSLLISHEDRYIHGYEVVQVDGSLLTYELEITESMVPNTYLSVIAMGDGEIYSADQGIVIPPEDKFLTVAIDSPQTRYRPQDSGSFRIQLRNSQGEGVQGQIGLGLVDEGIFVLRPDLTPDIRGFFYDLRYNVVGTELSSWFYPGTIAPLSLLPDGSPCWDSDQDGRKDIREDSNGDGRWDVYDCYQAENYSTPMPLAAEAMMDAAVFGQDKADGAGALAEATLRSDFRDTILWLPYVETDAEGYATVTVDFPDNLTSWRLTARAITLGDEVGQATSTVTTTLPVIARLASPRTLVRGDETVLRVIAQSNLEEAREVGLELSHEGLELLAGEDGRQSLPAGGRVHNDYRVRAESTGTISLEAAARTSRDADALQRELVVLPRAVRQDIAWARRLESGQAAWDFTLADSVDPSTLHGSLTLTPSLAAAVSPALVYLAGYPYGCTEQTMSRFLPSILAKEAGDLAKLPEDVAEELDRMVMQGLKRLYDFQLPQGGWGFWRNDEPNPYITAYVVSGMLQAQQAGYEVRSYHLERGVQALRRFVVEDSSFSNYRTTQQDARAYALYVLAQAQHALPTSEQTRLEFASIPFEETIGEVSAYGQALSALRFALLEDDEAAERSLDSLIALVQESQMSAFWDSDAPRYYWNDDAIETTAYGLEALIRIRPDSPLIPKVVNWLLQARQGQGWTSTKDTAAVVRAALTLTSQQGTDASSFSTEIMVNGSSLLAHTFSNDDQSLTVPLSELVAGENSLELQSDDPDASLYLSGHVTFYDEQPEADNDADEHFTITRRYQRLEAVSDEDGVSYQRRRVADGDTLQEGDVLLVTVRIAPSDAYRYVIVNEPTPAGFRVIENDQAFRIAGVTRNEQSYYGWNYPYNGREVRTSQVDYYFTSMTEPTYFTYLLRAESAGSYTALPTQAWLMYAPEQRGNGSTSQLMVDAAEE